MTTFLTVFSYIFTIWIGMFIGRAIGKRDIDKKNIDIAQFYQNQVKKQAVTIERIKDRLVYLSVNDIADLLDYMKSENGFDADDDYPVLAIVGPLEDADFSEER